MSLQSFNAHFDGEQIRLDSPVILPRDAKLIVTVVTDEDQAERLEWTRHSIQHLAAVYDDDEPDYKLSELKEINPDYEPR
jgi:hypothetical protein